MVLPTQTFSVPQTKFISPFLVLVTGHFTVTGPGLWLCMYWPPDVVYWPPDVVYPSGEEEKNSSNYSKKHAHYTLIYTTSCIAIPPLNYLSVLGRMPRCLPVECCYVWLVGTEAQAPASLRHASKVLLLARHVHNASVAPRHIGVKMPCLAPQFRACALKVNGEATPACGA